MYKFSTNLTDNATLVRDKDQLLCLEKKALFVVRLILAHKHIERQNS